MCLNCYFNLTDEAVHTRLTDALNEDNFAAIPFTHVQGLLAAASGFNGKEVRDLAMSVIGKYREYLLDNSWKVLYGVLSVRDLERKMKYIKDNVCEKRSKVAVFEYLDKL